MKLVVGLGNPGKDYEMTRHNIGFMIIDSYLGTVQYKEKFQSKYYEKIIGDEKVIFLKPETFINNSGISVVKFVNYFKIDISDLIIIYDDMDFEVGTFKIKPFGSAGGHNGMKSIINNLGTNKFSRIRVGISKPSYNTIDYVLGKFNKDEYEKVKKCIQVIDNVIDDYIKMDIDKLMSKYN